MGDSVQDPSQFASVMERHADTVLRVCTMYLHQRADAEDAFQETFIRFARHDEAFDDEGHVKAWLIRVASNVCKDMLRSAARRVESLDVSAEPPVAAERQNDLGLMGESSLFADPAESIGASSAGPPGSGGAGERIDLAAALRSLEERYRVPLFLKYYEGNSTAEIARTLGVPVNTVYTNISRGKARLREVLEHGRR